MRLESTEGREKFSPEIEKEQERGDWKKTVLEGGILSDVTDEQVSGPN